MLELAQKASGTQTSYHVLMGRCLVAISRERWFESVGCNSAIHFATSKLGLSHKEALRVYRVALDLTWLPRMSQAAENGTVSWSQLREMTGKASDETELMWLELAKKMSSREIQRLAKRTRKGEWPKLNEDGSPELDFTDFRCRSEANTVEIFEHVTRKLSEEAGRPFSGSEVIAHLCAERLAKGLPDEKFYQAVEKSAKLRRAHRRSRDELLIQQARAVASELGLQEPVIEDPEARPSRVEDIEVEAGAPGSVKQARPATVEVEPAVQGSIEEARPARVGEQTPMNPRIKFNFKARTATPAQRQELQRRDGYRCCHHLWLEAHHLIEFSAGGPTNWKNLRMVCSACHRNIHKGHLKIVRHGDGSLSFTDAAGCDLRQSHDLEVAGWLNDWQGWFGEEYDSHQHRASNGSWSTAKTAVGTTKIAFSG